MTGEPRALIRAVLDAPERVADVPAAALPGVLGQLAELQAIFLARLMAGGNGADQAPAPAEPDRLLTAEEAGAILGVTPRWLYRHAQTLRFARRLSRKVLRFSEAGLRRYAATRRP